MNSFVKGTFKDIIYKGDGNFYIALFKVEKSSIESINKKLITVTGIFLDLKLNFPYYIEGTYEKNPKYSWQFNSQKYEIIMPTKKEEIVLFLTSSFIKGCSKKTAEKIVELYEEETLNIIKNDYKTLLKVDNMKEANALKIYNSLLLFNKNEKYVNALNKYGFSFEESSKILANHEGEIDEVLNGNFYLLKDLFDFKRLDNLYLESFEEYSLLRIKECFLSSMMAISFYDGSTYHFLENIISFMQSEYKLSCDIDTLNIAIDNLIKDGSIIKIENHYYLKKYYEEEKYIAHFLYLLASKKSKNVKVTKEDISFLEKKYNIKYNGEQIDAIKNALDNKVSIISGGPGTGKTTIIKAITSLYIKDNKLSNFDIAVNIALLAPTGRASKKMSEATGLSAYTIHRYLKWHKDKDYFEYNIDNKLPCKFVIVDEASMLDVSLLYSLVSALNDNCHIVFVGDINQLPSVGPGLVLEDIIKSDYFSYTLLNTIYRQSDNSYIPYLAKDIKIQNMDDDYMYKRDDYAFLVSDNDNIINTITKAVKVAIKKGIDDNKLQILCPIYKGVNGIDNINKHLQEIFNPKESDKNEIIYKEKVFRENDKVLQLVNDSDNNVFNGDIGRIIAIYKDTNKKDIIEVDFDDSVCFYTKKDLKNITHAYAISVHKAQGSEFDHVIMPICNNYFLMLYNKLLYTAVSRAKKSLTIIGDPKCFISAINNNYSKERRTSLKENLKNEFNA